MQKYVNNIQDLRGNALYGATITIYDSLGALATIYSDNGITTQTNPITADAEGEFSFYAANGRYSLHVAYTGSTTQILSDIVLFDPAPSTAAGDVGASDGSAGSLWTTAQGFINKILSSAGASVVGFIQAGTGAVATTISQALGEQASVLRFMTPAQIADVQTRTTTLDVTAAIQAAINTGAKRIYAPTGTYLFTTLTIPASCYIYGDGDGITIFQTATVGNAFQFTTSTSHRVTFKDFTLQQSGAVQGNGMAMDDCYWFSTENVHIKGFVNNIYASRSLYHTHKRIFSENSTNGVNYWGNAGTWNVNWYNNVITFDTPRCSGCTVTGLAVKGAEVTCINPDFSGMTTAGAIGFKAYGDASGYYAHGIKVISPYVELTQIPFNFSYAKIEIDGGFVQGGSSAPNQYTSIIDADNSTIFWSQVKDQDYWANGWRLTNNTTLTFRSSFSGSIRAGNSVDATSKSLTDDYDEGTFTATLTGCTTSPTGTVSYVRKGKMVTLSIPTISGTSNTTACSITGLPNALNAPVGTAGMALVFDSGASFNGNFQVANINAISFYKGPYGTAFTNTGVKGVQACTITYPLF